MTLQKEALEAQQEAEEMMALYKEHPTPALKRAAQGAAQRAFMLAVAAARLEAA